MITYMPQTAIQLTGNNILWKVNIKMGPELLLQPSTIPCLHVWYNVTLCFSTTSHPPHLKATCDVIYTSVEKLHIHGNFQGM